jgi:hypothetical protein
VVYLDSSLVYNRVKGFLEKYGDKGFLVLKAALEIAGDPNVDHRYGDFSFKHLVLRLARMGFNYNPVNLLRTLEKELGVIEKSYSSTNQTWWRFTDIEAVKRAIGADTVEDDPKITLLRIKFESLEPRRVKSTLLKLASKNALTATDREVLRRIVFGELSKMIELYQEMAGYEDYFGMELEEIRELVKLAEFITLKMSRETPVQAGGLPLEGSLRALRVNDNT